MGIREYISKNSSFITEKKNCKKEEMEPEEKETKELQEEKVDSKEIISDLGKLDWGKDNDAKNKAFQLLKGLFFSEEKEALSFIKELSDASTSIATKLLKTETKEEEKEEVKESVITKAVEILEGIEDEKYQPKQKDTSKQSSITSRATDLL